MKFKLKLLAALILGTLSLPGHSRVYEYTIKDIYGVEKSVSADSAKLNTTEKIQLSLISGLDRKIRVTVKKRRRECLQHDDRKRESCRSHQIIIR
ncbi:hypothetical protein [Klebsiella pneumoniae]|uniref:hypothetical protein n=1 Tax=Klebsiella pneumoniae TaxID=573 RepID=UPI0022784635|nr:hypothetical protein [Klebsiella pneumoniae]